MGTKAIKWEKGKKRKIKPRKEAIRSQKIARDVANNLSNAVESTLVEDILFFTFEFISRQLSEKRPVYINGLITFDILERPVFSDKRPICNILVNKNVKKIIKEIADTKV